MDAPKRRGPAPIPPAQRFESKTRPAANGCIEWAGSINGSGYGTFYAGERKSVVAHRWAYQHYVGDIPPGMYLDHLCRNRTCVNPSHLEPVTQRENLRRGETNASKAHCPQRHPYSEENTYVVPSSGQRKCRTCMHVQSMSRSKTHRKAKTIGRI